MTRSTLSSIVALSAITALAAAWPLGQAPAGAPDHACCADAAVSIKHSLTLEGANQVLAAAMAKARERSAGGAIAVVDDGGNLVAFQRLDNTFAAGAAVSIGKARTAAIFKKPTKAFEDSINGGRIALAAVGEMTPLQGGVPIVHEGFIIGAIGVSGAHNQAEDEEIAIAGADALASGPTAAR